MAGQVRRRSSLVRALPASSMSASAWRGPSGPAGRSLAGGEDGGGSRAGLRQADPALVARSGPGTEKHPFEADPSVGLERPQATQQARPAIGSGQVTDGARAAPRAGRGGRPSRRIGRRSSRPAPARRPARVARAARAAASTAAREPAARDSGRRSSAPAAGPAAAGAARPRGRDRRSAWPRTAGRAGCLGQDDPERLAPPELDQDGLAELEVAQPLRHEVGVRPVAARGIDRDLDGPAPADGDTARRRAGPPSPSDVGQGQGERG